MNNEECKEYYKEDIKPECEDCDQCVLESIIE